MSSRSWLDTRDAQLLPFASNFSTRASATPAAYGLVAGDATALATLYGNYNTALTTASNPATRTSVTIAAKDVAKAALITELRLLYKKINAANLAADKREELGLPIRDITPSPIAPPATKAVAMVLGKDGVIVDLRVKDELTLESKAKPPGAAGYELLCAVTAAGAPAPMDDRQYFSFGVAKKSDRTIAFEAADLGKTAHLRPVWISPRGARGPMGDAVSVNLAA
jgi:hypothetical protein